jgi:hypothetical protein
VKLANIKKISSHYILIGKYHFISYSDIIKASKEVASRPSFLSQALTHSGIAHKQPLATSKGETQKLSLTPVLKKLVRFEEDPELK